MTLVFSSCNQSDELQENNETEVGSVDFSIQENNAIISSSKNKKETKLSAKTNALTDVTKAIITITGADGSATDFTNTELDVYTLNGNLFVQKIVLPVGDYKLEAFSFIDASNEIIYVAPMSGSNLAYFVSSPLAINFTIGNGVAAAVDVEVISTEVYTPADFGLVSFPVTEVETLDFLLAVSELGGNEILAGDYTISTTGFSATNTFSAIEENVIKVKDIADAVYTLSISVDGYESYTIDLTRDQIVDMYYATPLVVELLKIVSVEGFTGVFSELNWITTGVIARNFSGATLSFDCGSGGGGIVSEITIPSNGTISFDWDIVIRSAGQYGDNISYVINGVGTTLSASGSASGTVTIPVSAGDVFKFSTWGTTQSSSYYGSYSNFLFTY